MPRTAYRVTTTAFGKLKYTACYLLGGLISRCLLIVEIMKHKEAIEILQEQLNISDHFSRYPQDRHKDKPQEIKVLITTSEYHKKRVEQLKSSIALLVNADK